MIAKMIEFLSTGRPVEADSVTYMLRTCNADMSSRKRFVWPKEGGAEAPDWSPTAECGAGLHGLLLGAGDSSLLSTHSNAVWLVCAVWRDDVIDLSGKVKVPRAYVVYAGTRDEATSLLHRLGAPACCYVTASAGEGSMLTAGHRSMLTAGNSSTLTAGYDSKLQAGYDSKLQAGHSSKLQAGNHSKFTAGDGSKLQAGGGSTLTAGEGSTLKAGDGSTLRCEYWDGKRMRTTVAYVGDDIEPNVAYKCVYGKFLKVS